jgi:hypothetical protein
MCKITRAKKKEIVWAMSVKLHDNFLTLALGMPVKLSNAMFQI